MKSVFLVCFGIGVMLLQLSCKDKEDVIQFTACDQALDGWKITSSEFPVKYRQNDISFPTDDTGYSVGQTGYILKTNNGGYDWHVLQYYYSSETGINHDAITRAALKTTWFVNELVGFVGGEGEMDFLNDIHTDAVFLKTIDGGETWDKKYLEGVYEIHDLVFFDQEHGMSLVTIHQSNGSFAKQIRVTFNAGDDWTEVVLPQVKIDAYNLVITPSMVRVLAEDESGHPFLCSTSDQGETWSIRALPTAQCFDVIFFNDDIGLANCLAGIYPEGIYRTLDGGDSWTEIQFPAGYWSMIHFATPQEGFVIQPLYTEMQGGGEIWAYVSSYKVFQTFDGGVTWVEKNIMADCAFEGIQFSPSSNLLYNLGDSFIRFEKE